MIYISPGNSGGFCSAYGRYGVTIFRHNSGRTSPSEAPRGSKMNTMFNLYIHQE